MGLTAFLAGLLLVWDVSVVLLHIQANPHVLVSIHSCTKKWVAILLPSSACPMCPKPAIGIRKSE